MHGNDIRMKSIYSSRWGSSLRRGRRLLMNEGCDNVATMVTEGCKCSGTTHRQPPSAREERQWRGCIRIQTQSTRVRCSIIALSLSSPSTSNCRHCDQQRLQYNHSHHNRCAIFPLVPPCTHQAHPLQHAFFRRYRNLLLHVKQPLKIHHHRRQDNHQKSPLSSPSPSPSPCGLHRKYLAQSSTSLPQASRALQHKAEH